MLNLWMLTAVPDGGSSRADGMDGSPSLIDEIVREGAWRMLALALRAGVDVYMAAYAAEWNQTAAAWWRTRTPG